MQPLPGHPYVAAGVSHDPYGSMLVLCYCALCGDRWEHRCEFAAKAPVWVARYAAQHHHGAPGVRDHFALQYHTGLQALRR